MQRFQFVVSSHVATRAKGHTGLSEQDVGGGAEGVSAKVCNVPFFSKSPLNMPFLKIFNLK